MENAINSLYIQNFKSIRRAQLHPRRVNLFIGEPNVGKSTMLEAISLLGSFAYETKKKFMRSFVRYEEPTHLFHNNQPTSSIRIESDREVCLVGGGELTKIFRYGVFSQATYQRLRTSLGHPPVVGPEEPGTNDEALFLDHLHAHLTESPDAPESGFLYTEFNRHGAVDQPGGKGRFLTSTPPWYPQPVKPYRYKRSPCLHRCYNETSLRPPHGSNLVQVLESHAGLRREFDALFARQGLRLHVRPDNGRLELLRDIDGHSVAYPYCNSGDTLQVYGFYLAVLESNHDTVLLLEEPETHSFPAYVTRLAERIATQRTNQFFVTTHSPYLFNEILEGMVPYENRVPELAVFVMHHNGFESEVRQLTDEEVRNLRRDGADVFRDLSQLVPTPKVQEPRPPMFQQRAVNLGSLPAV